MPELTATLKNGTPYTIKQSNNQKLFQIHRDQGINFEYNYTALKNLSQNAYTLYMYLIMHNPNRIWALSSKNIFEHTPLKKKTYMLAMHELQDKNYITPGAIKLSDNYIYNNNTYHIWESPYRCGSKMTPQV